MTKEQYEKIKDIWQRKSLYPLEVDAIFDLFIEVEGWNPGCRTCPSNLTFVQDRLTPKIQAYLDKVKQEEAAKENPELKKEEVKDKPVKKTTTTSKKK